MWSAGERRARETERERNGTQRDLSRGQKVNGTIEWERFNQELHKSPPHEHPLDLVSLDPFFLSTIYRPRETARCSSFRPPSLPTLCLTRSRFMPRISPPCPGHGINYAPYALAGILQPVPVFAPLLIRAPLHPLQFRLLSCFPHPITTIPPIPPFASAGPLFTAISAILSSVLWRNGGVLNPLSKIRHRRHHPRRRGRSILPSAKRDHSFRKIGLSRCGEENEMTNATTQDLLHSILHSIF